MESISKPTSTAELERQYIDLMLEYETYIAEAVDLQERLLALGEIELAAHAEQTLKNAEEDHRRVREILATIKFLNEIEAITWDQSQDR